MLGGVEDGDVSSRRRLSREHQFDELTSRNHKAAQRIAFGKNGKRILDPN